MEVRNISRKDGKLIFNKHFQKLIDDKNIFIDFESNIITVCSYDRCLLEDMSYVKNTFKKIKNHKERFETLLDTEVFILRVDGFNIDGLYETNSKLLNKESKIYCNY